MLTAYTTALPPSSLPPGPALAIRVDAHAAFAGAVVVLAVLAALLLRSRAAAQAPRALHVVGRASDVRVTRTAA